MENFICNRYGERLHILSTKNIKICLHFLQYLLNISKKMTFFISQGSVVICLMWGGYCRMHFVVNFIRFPAVQKVLKSVKIHKSNGKGKGNSSIGYTSNERCSSGWRQRRRWNFLDDDGRQCGTSVLPTTELQLGPVMYEHGPAAIRLSAQLHKTGWDEQ